MGGNSVQKEMDKERETVTWLEMHALSDLRTATGSLATLAITRVTSDIGASGRDLYRLTGADWRWVDRLDWSEQQWQDHYTQQGVYLWLCSDGDRPAGYFELQRYPDNSVEIAYFGLLPGYIGRGHGGLLLTRAVEEAWRLSPGRVWVHTSSHDHRYALDNYLSRGFTIYKTEIVNATG